MLIAGSEASMPITCNRSRSFDSVLANDEEIVIGMKGSCQRGVLWKVAH